MTSTVIDDQNLSAVHYNGSWIRGGSTNEHDGTVASSTNVGDSFTVSFYGNSISVYGTIDATSAGVLTNYSVDNDPAVQMTSQAGAGDTFNQQFWKSPVLEVGEHHLVVTMVKLTENTGPGEGTIWFDYFLATDPTIRQQAAHKKARIGKIVGGVLGGLLALHLVVFFVNFLMKREKKKKMKTQPQAFQWPKNGSNAESPSDSHVGGFVTNQPTGPIAPFPYEPGHQDSLNTLPANILNATPSGSLPRKSMLMNQSRRQVSGPSSHSTHPSSTTIPSSPSEDHARELTRNVAYGKHQRLEYVISDTTLPETGASSSLHSDSLPTETVQHIDSGARAINAQTDLDVPTTRIELPPVYSPV